jgi:uncharacterized membrane protein
MTRVFAIATIILIVLVFLVTLYVYPQLPKQSAGALEPGRQSG